MMEINITERPLKAVVLGASSDIGNALCMDWIEKNWAVWGTYRTMSPSVEKLQGQLQDLVQCALDNVDSVDKACEILGQQLKNWDVVVLGPGLQEPIGLFESCDFDEWAHSIEVNFINQLRFLRGILPTKNQEPSENGPTVIFFAGGGVNNAPIRYSAYTVAKVAMVKMVELLAAEMPDVKFVIIGPGWVKTKIHNSVLASKENAGASYARTIEKFKNNEFVPMDKVVECCNVMIEGDKAALTGRNISVEFDCWSEPQFLSFLNENSNIYKLRRFGNDL
jgi:NAD(P)-dependent dehydrogenase (short-subunit alcohol dehydrogenase family)